MVLLQDGTKYHGRTISVQECHEGNMRGGAKGGAKFRTPEQLEKQAERKEEWKRNKAERLESKRRSAWVCPICFASFSRVDTTWEDFMSEHFLPTHPDMLKPPKKACRVDDLE